MEQESSLLEGAFVVPEIETDDEVQETEEITDDEYSLLYLGYLTDTIEIGSNTVRLRTLKIGEELSAALLASKYQDTIEAARALATALVAASVVSVNNKPLLTDSMGPGDSGIEAKFDFVLKNWYWITVDKLFGKYNELIERVKIANESVKKE